MNGNEKDLKSKLLNLNIKYMKNNQSININNLLPCLNLRDNLNDNLSNNLNDLYFTPYLLLGKNDNDNLNNNLDLDSKIKDEIKQINKLDNLNNSIKSNKTFDILSIPIHSNSKQKKPKKSKHLKLTRSNIMYFMFSNTIKPLNKVDIWKKENNL